MRLLHSVNESHHQHSKEKEEEEKDEEKDEEEEEKNETKETNNVASDHNHVFDLNAVLSELDAAAAADAADPASSARLTYVEGFDLVLFDGHCNFCNASINFLMMFDTDKR